MMQPARQIRATVFSGTDQLDALRRGGHDGEALGIGADLAGQQSPLQAVDRRVPVVDLGRLDIASG